MSSGLPCRGRLLILLAVLSGIGLAAVPARATRFVVMRKTSGAINLAAASFPNVGRGFAGSWTVVELDVTNRSSAVTVDALITANGRSWSTSGYVPANGAAEIDIAVPAGVVEVELGYSLRVSGEDRAMGSLQIHRNTDRANSLYAVVSDGGRRPAWLKPIGPHDFALLGQYLQCLDYLRAIVISAEMTAPSWRLRPGIDAWVRAGGVLVQIGKPSWSEYGSGAVVVVSSNRYHAWVTGAAGRWDLDALVLSTRSNILSENQSSRGDLYCATRWIEPPTRAFPEEDRPLAILGLIVALYLVVLIPGNYLLLRRRGLREAAWITIPILALVTSGVILGICLWQKGMSVVEGRVSLVEEGSPGVYQAVGYVSVFAPRSGDYTLRVPPNALPESLPAIYSIWNSRYTALDPSLQSGTMTETPSATLCGLSIPQWSSRTVRYAFTPHIAGAITGMVNYQVGRSSSVLVHNGSNLLLEDCRVWTGAECLKLGTLLPGGDGKSSGRPIDGSTLVSGQPALSFEQRVREREFQQICSRFGPRFGSLSGAAGLGSDAVGWAPAETQSVFLVGWTRAPLQTATVVGATQSRDEGLVIVPLTVVESTVDDMPDYAVPRARIDARGSSNASVSASLYALQLPANIPTRAALRVRLWPGQPMGGGGYPGMGEGGYPFGNGYPGMTAGSGAATPYVTADGEPGSTGFEAISGGGSVTATSVTTTTETATSNVSVWNSARKMWVRVVRLKAIYEMRVRIAPLRDFVIHQPDGASLRPAIVCFKYEGTSGTSLAIMIDHPATPAHRRGRPSSGRVR